MPTRNPRVNVCVTPAQHQLLAKLGTIQGRSAASIVREMIDAAEPLMVRTVKLFDIAEEANATTQKAALDALRDVLEEIKALSGHPDQADLLSLLSEASGGGDAANPAPSGAREESAAPPPSSNTGVRSSGPSDLNAVDRG